jgi:magnesium and cobalt transporter
MQHFRTAHSHLAVVVDEYGGTAGIVTNDNLVSRIIGDLPLTSDADETSSAERLDDNNYRVDGNLSVRTWAERFAVGEIDDHIDTVGGLILSKLGRVPQVGDEVCIRNLTLTVDSMSRQRIRQVLIKRNPHQSDATEAAA